MWPSSPALCHFFPLHPHIPCPSFPLFSTLPQGPDLCVTAVQILGKGRQAYQADTQDPLEQKKREVWLLQRKGHVSQIIQFLCLLRFWQVDWLCLQRRPSDSRYQPLSALSATQTRTATAAADISARWVVPFASLLNVRKYQAVFNSILSFWSPSMTLFCFSYLSLPSFCLAVCLFFILHCQTELNRWSFQCNICKHITEKCFFLLPEHTVRNIRHVVDFK